MAGASCLAGPNLVPGMNKPHLMGQLGQGVRACAELILRSPGRHLPQRAGAFSFSQISGASTLIRRFEFHCLRLSHRELWN